MDKSLQDLRTRVSDRFADIAKSDLSQADKTFLERLTMQGGIENWPDRDKRRYSALASLMVDRR
jgi:hypothetical protein